MNDTLDMDRIARLLGAKRVAPLKAGGGYFGALQSAAEFLEKRITADSGVAMRSPGKKSPADRKKAQSEESQTRPSPAMLSHIVVVNAKGKLKSVVCGSRDEAERVVRRLLRRGIEETEIACFSRDSVGDHRPA